MKLKEFIEKTNLSKKTCQWLAKNIFKHDTKQGTPTNYTNDDVEWVLNRQIDRFSKIHNIKRMEETSDEYYIEDDGRIYSYKRGFLESRWFNVLYGYNYVGLWNNGNKNYRVHRLVGKYFVPNDDPENNIVINHKGGDKQNNHYTNLEWTTISANTKHAFDMGLLINDKGANDSQAIPINIYDSEGIFIKHYGCMKDAAQDLDIPISTIGKLAKTPERISRKYKIKVQYA